MFIISKADDIFRLLCKVGSYTMQFMCNEIGKQNLRLSNDKRLTPEQRQKAKEKYEESKKLSEQLKNTNANRR